MLVRRSACHSTHPYCCSTCRYLASDCSVDMAQRTAQRQNLYCLCKCRCYSPLSHQRHSRPSPTPLSRQEVESRRRHTDEPPVPPLRQPRPDDYRESSYNQADIHHAGPYNSPTHCPSHLHPYCCIPAVRSSSDCCLPARYRTAQPVKWRRLFYSRLPIASSNCLARNVRTESAS